MEERVHLGTRSERVPQIEERERNGVTFLKAGTEQERNAQKWKERKRNAPFLFRSFSVNILKKLKQNCFKNIFKMILRLFIQFSDEETPYLISFY